MDRWFMDGIHAPYLNQGLPQSTGLGIVKTEVMDTDGDRKTVGSDQLIVYHSGSR